MFFVCVGAALIIDAAGEAGTAAGAAPAVFVLPPVIDAEQVSIAEPDAVPATAQVHTLHFSHEAGLYAEPFYLKITATYENARIYFTLDGSEPVAGEAYLLDGALYIADRTPTPNVLSAIPGRYIGCFIVYSMDYFIPPEEPVFKATVIRARAFYGGKAVSGIFTKTFFVCENIFTRYAGLPIISLVTDAANFFCDEIGIYVRGHNNTGGHEPGTPTPNWAQRGREWERPVHVEIFEPCGARVSQNMGVRIHGGATRRLAQKSLRLYARAEYDPLRPVLRHDIFQGGAVDFFGEPIVEFERLLLRNFGNEGTGTMLRDTGQQYLARHMNVNVQAQRHAIVLLNGEFWGLYDIKERHCERFLAKHYRAHHNDFTVLSMVGGRARATLDAGRESDLYDFLRLESFMRENSFACDEMFAIAERHINIESLIDHFIINIFFGNIDWPNHNARVWRYNGLNLTVLRLDGRWNWKIHDLDSTSGFGFGFNYNEDTLIRLLLFPNAREYIRNDVSLHPAGTLMFRRLMENEGFRAAFFARFKYVIENYFNATAFLAMVDRLADNIAHAVPEQIQRFGRINSVEQWEAELEIFRTFGTRRPEYMPEFISRAISEINDEFFTQNREYIVLIIDGEAAVMSVPPIMLYRRIMLELEGAESIFGPLNDIAQTAPAFTVGGRLFIPLSAITTARGYSYTWQAATYTVLLDT